MKKTIIILIITLFFSSTVHSQTSFFAESQSYVSKSVYSPFEFIWASKYFDSSNWGIFVFAAVSNSWGEIYAGPSYTFRSNKNSQNFLEVGIGAGIETDKNPHREAIYAFLNRNPDPTGMRNKGKIQGLLNAEYGGTGYWYLGFITYNVSEKFALGIHGQSFTGVWGPRIQWQKKSLMIYSVPGYSLERKEYGITAALRYYF